MAHEPKLSQKHYSVMPQEVLAALDVKKGEIVVDGTYGQGGHSRLLSRAAKIRLISLDADPAAGVITANFGDFAEVMGGLGVKEVNKVLLDLGWNRGQLSSGRGFSFMRDEPLIMSYSDTPRSGFAAAEILNTFAEKALADIFFGYGEERYARRIAAAVVLRRDAKPYETTFELVETIKDAVPPAYRRGRLHPATKSFQALRIAVNDELGVIEKGLRAAWGLLACEGRIAVITFHSVEDRLVKRIFAEFKKGGGELVYKKPLVPTQGEVRENASSRSAKLRAIAKPCHER